MAPSGLLLDLKNRTSLCFDVVWDIVKRGDKLMDLLGRDKADVKPELPGVFNEALIIADFHKSFLQQIDSLLGNSIWGH